jgi:hypothetical protein
MRRYAESNRPEEAGPAKSFFQEMSYRETPYGLFNFAHAHSSFPNSCFFCRNEVEFGG